MSALFDLGWFGFEPLLADIAGSLVLIVALVITILMVLRIRRRIERASAAATSSRTVDAQEANFIDDIFSGEQFATWSPIHLLRARYAHGELDDDTYRRLEKELQDRAR